MPAHRDLRHRTAAAWPDLEAYLEELEFDGKADGTIIGYERSLARLLRDNPGLGFAEFDKPTIMRTLSSVPARSRYISRSIYQGWFAWGVREDRLDRNPMDKIKKLKAGPRRPSNIYSEEEVAILLNRPMPNGALWAILFGTGLRKDDAVRLKRSWIDLERMRLTVYKGKGGKDAVIPFGPDLAIAIADLDLLERLNPDDHLWRRERYNRSRLTPVSKATFDRWYQRELEAAGIPYRNPHQTRHTCHWLMKHVEGLGLEERQFVMRHESPVTTIRQYPVVDLEDVARLRSREAL